MNSPSDTGGSGKSSAEGTPTESNFMSARQLAEAIAATINSVDRYLEDSRHGCRRAPFAPNCLQLARSLRRLVDLFDEFLMLDEPAREYLVKILQRIDTECEMSRRGAIRCHTEGKGEKEK